MQIRNWAALAALALSPAFAQGQSSHPIEFGVDAGVSITSGDPKVTTISVPVQSLRVGFYVTERVAIEPALAFNYAKSGDFSFSTLSPELGLLYDLTESRREPQFFVRPFAGVIRTAADDGTGSESVTVSHVGAGLGVKVPFGAVERFTWRIEALFDHSFENTDKAIDAENAFGLKLGLSFFTK